MNNAEKRDDMLAAEYALGTLREARGFSSRKGLPMSPLWPPA